MVKVLNQTTQAVFHLDTLNAAEILKKYHFLKVAEASEQEKQELAHCNTDVEELAILGSQKSDVSKPRKSKKE